MTSPIENERMVLAPLIESSVNDLIEEYQSSPLPLYRQVQLHAQKIATQQAKVQFQQKHPWISYLLGLILEPWFCRPSVREIQNATVNLISRIKLLTSKCKKTTTEKIFKKVFSRIEEISFVEKPIDEASYELFKNEFSPTHIEDHEIDLLIYNELFDQPIFGNIHNPEKRKHVSEKLKKHSTPEQREAVLHRLTQKIRKAKPKNPLEYLRTEKLQEQYRAFKSYLEKNQKSIYKKFNDLPHPIDLQVFECAWINSEMDRSVSKNAFFSVCKFLYEPGLADVQNLTLLINFFMLNRDVAFLNQSTFIMHSEEVDRMNRSLAQNQSIDNTSVIQDCNRFQNTSIRFDHLSLISQSSGKSINIENFDQFLQEKGIIDPDHREIIARFSTQGFSNETVALTITYLKNKIPNLDFSKYPLRLSDELDLSIETISSDRITIKRTVKGPLIDSSLRISDPNIPIEVTCTFELEKNPNGTWQCNNNPTLTIRTHSNSERFIEAPAPRQYFEYDISNIQFDAYEEPLHKEYLDSDIEYFDE